MGLKLDHRDTTSMANVLTEPFHETLGPSILLHDNTLREGEQPPGVAFSADQKLELATMLSELGVPWMSVGFPAVSSEEKVAAERIVKAGLRTKTTALARMVPDDIAATIDVGVDRVSLFFATSDGHLRHKYGCSEDEAVARIHEGISFARQRGARCIFTAEDASRTPFPRLLRVFQVAADAGAELVKIADTVGVLTPASAAQLVTALRTQQSCPVGVHFHNDLGLALANTLAALAAGAEMADVTVNGVGERAGNTCLEEIAVLLKVKFGRDLGMSLDKLATISRYVHEISGTRAPEHKPIVGKWSFTHEAGIHVAGVLADPETYQAFPPSLVGRHHEIAFGKHSGAQSVAYLAASAGVSLSAEDRAKILRRVKSQAETSSGQVDEALVLAWIRELTP